MNPSQLIVSKSVPLVSLNPICLMQLISAESSHDWILKWVCLEHLLLLTVCWPFLLIPIFLSVFCWTSWTLRYVFLIGSLFLSVYHMLPVLIACRYRWSGPKSAWFGQCFPPSYHLTSSLLARLLCIDVVESVYVLGFLFSRLSPYIIMCVCNPY